MSHLSRKNLRLLLLTVFAISCVIILRFSGSISFKIGSLKIPASTIGGVFSGILSLICILLVFVDYKYGFRIAVILNLISSGNLIFSMIMSYVHTKNFDKAIVSMPGAVTNFVSLVTLITIFFFYKRLSVSNMTDYITGQGNRRSYVNEVNEHLESKKSFTLACIELEDFKHTIDLYGIKAGDYLLKTATEKLSSILNRKDKLFRITGSTFAILFEPGESPEERLKNVINSENIIIPFDSEDDSTTETTSVLSLCAGVVYSHPPYNYTKTASTVLRDAETALTATRNMSEHKICIYNENMENSELKQREAEFLVKDGLKNNYFYLVYQPQFSTDEKTLRGFETLIRCRKPDCSIVSPVAFIPAAEKSNLIMKIDEFVLKTAMTEFKSLLENSDLDLTVSINVSAKTMCSKNFASKMKALIDELQFPSEKLEIEITEYSFAESLDTTIANIQALHEMGIRIAIDDFGTGYTSIKQLMTLPINLLKIDKSLIDDIETSQSMRDIVDSVIYMGHIMNCDVISEGVEKEGQLDILRSHKCDFIQGFVWGKPMDFEDAKTLCRQEEY